MMVQETEPTVATEEAQAPEAVLQEALPTPVEEAAPEVTPEVEPDPDAVPPLDEVTEDSLRESHPDIFSAFDARNEEAIKKAHKDGNAKAQTRLQQMFGAFNQGLTVSNVALTQDLPAEIRKAGEAGNLTDDNIGRLLDTYSAKIGGYLNTAKREGVDIGVRAVVSLVIGDDKVAAAEWEERFGNVMTGADTYGAIAEDIVEQVRETEADKWKTKVKQQEGKVAQVSAANRVGKGPTTSATSAISGGGKPYADLTPEGRKELRDTDQVDQYIAKNG